MFPVDGPGSGTPLLDAADNVEIPLRVRGRFAAGEDVMNDAFRHRGGGGATVVSLVYLTHGTKTGLIAPVSPPRGVDVIVDACQARSSRKVSRRI